MKKQVLSMGLCLLLLLSGCASLLERSHSTETAHVQFSDAEKDSDVLQAETYQGLMSALLFLVSQGEETGVIRLYNYTGSAESDLETAGVELTQEDPLGAYAVDYMKYELSRVMNYYEVEIDISYRRSYEEISQVVSVTGASAIVGELRTMLAEFQGAAALQVSYFEKGMTISDVEALVMEAYYSTPDSALGRPEVSVTLYPQETEGRRRLVEIVLTYPEEGEQLQNKKAALLAYVQELSLAEVAGTAQEKVAWVQDFLGEQVVLSGEAGGEDATAYAALLEGAANEEGLCLAAKLLCDGMGISAQVVQGQQYDKARFWLVIGLEDYARHWNPAEETAVLRSDSELAALGYSWEAGVPACADLE